MTPRALNAPLSWIDPETGVSAPADRATHEPNPQAVSAVPVGIPDAVVTEYPGEAVTLFTVRASWEWASVFVRPLPDGGEVAINSSYGTYGYVWGNMGCDWRKFLPSLSREYAMRKLAGRAYEVPLNHEEFIAAMRQSLDDDEKSILDSWGVLDPDQERKLAACRDALDDEWGWEDVPLEALFWHFNEQAGGVPYAMELYETRMTKINPQVAGFWDTIWTPFADHLAQGIEAATVDETGTGSAVGESPVVEDHAPEPSTQTHTTKKKGE